MLKRIESREHEENKVSDETFIFKTFYLHSKLVFIWITDSKLYNYIILFFSVWVLFINDVLNLGVPIELDDYFNAFILFIFFCFMLEITANVVFKQGYLWSFYIITDFLSLVSLIPDVSLLFNVMLSWLSFLKKWL